MADAPGETAALTVSEEEAGLRLDAWLTGALEDASRSFVKKLIKDAHVHIDGQPATKPARTMQPGAQVNVRLPPPPGTTLEPEDLPLDVLYEDADVLVVNKAAGMVVHPAPGHPNGTLVNAVLHHCPDFLRPGEDAGRPGIVHRLDRDTSGVMVVAKNECAMRSLAAQAASHAFDRRYLALVQGTFKETRGRISADIGRSLADRKRMAVTGVGGRTAVTHFETLETYGVASLVGLQLETGRTHQIRVHLRFAGRPVLGDPVYGITDFRGWQVAGAVRQALTGLVGQALHAESLGFDHPAHGERIHFQAPPSPDFQAAWDALRAWTEPTGS